MKEDDSPPILYLSTSEMKAEITFKCPHCQHINNLKSNANWINLGKQSICRSRPFGDEILHTGTASVSCSKCGKTINLSFNVKEYTRGVARVQEVFQDGNLLTDEADLGLLSSKYQVKPFLYGTRFPNRNNLDYFIVDKASEHCATTLLNDIVFLFGINPSPVDFPVVSLPKWPGWDNDYLPAAVSSCMNLISRKLSVNMSKPCSESLVKPIREELIKLGYNTTIKSLKSNCENTLGNCAEVNAANSLLRKSRTTLDNLLFGLVIRPRTMQILLPCPNCSTFFPTL